MRAPPLDLDPVLRHLHGGQSVSRRRSATLSRPAARSRNDSPEAARRRTVPAYPPCTANPIPCSGVLLHHASHDPVRPRHGRHPRRARRRHPARGRDRGHRTRRRVRRRRRDPGHRCLHAAHGRRASSTPAGPRGSARRPRSAPGGASTSRSPAAVACRPTGVSAVVLNLTAVAPTSRGYLTAYPSTLARPTASSINFNAGWTGANLVTVPMDGGGKVRIFNASGQTHAVADVVGYYHSSASTAASPRLVRGRPTPTGSSTPASRAVGPHPARSAGVPLGVGGLHESTPPSTRALQALALNVTVVAPTRQGHITVFNGTTRRGHPGDLDAELRRRTHRPEHGDRQGRPLRAAGVRLRRHAALRGGQHVIRRRPHRRRRRRLVLHRGGGRQRPPLQVAGVAEALRRLASRPGAADEPGTQLREDRHRARRPSPGRARVPSSRTPPRRSPPSPPSSPRGRQTLPVRPSATSTRTRARSSRT